MVVQHQERKYQHKLPPKSIEVKKPGFKVKV